MDYGNVAVGIGITIGRLLFVLIHIVIIKGAVIAPASYWIGKTGRGDVPVKSSCMSIRIIDHPAQSSKSSGRETDGKEEAGSNTREWTSRKIEVYS